MGRNTKRIGDAVKESEEARNVDSLGNLFFLPTGHTELLHVFGRGSVSCPRDDLNIFEQSTLGGSKAGLIELAFNDRLYA